MLHLLLKLRFQIIASVQGVDLFQPEMEQTTKKIHGKSENEVKKYCLLMIFCWNKRLQDDIFKSGFVAIQRTPQSILRQVEHQVVQGRHFFLQGPTSIVSKSPMKQFV